MTSDIALTQDFIILDACCVITLYQTGRMADILRSLPKPVAVADYVYNSEILRADLQDLVEDGLLIVVSTESVDEMNTFVNLAVHLDDGEAITGAIALHRNWSIATDDRKALSLFARVASQLEIISTLRMIKHWAETSVTSYEEIQTALYNMRVGAPYEPKQSHPLYKWWRIYID